MAAKVKPPNTTKQEVAFATAFLRYLHANSNNVYLLLAVIAWVRGESGKTYRGNNPLNIRRSKFAISFRQTRGNGQFAVFANLDTAAKASAYLLMHGPGFAHYGLIVAAAQRQAAGAADQQRQAIDFFQALVMSAWDAGHYGLSEDQRKDPNAIYTTVLYSVWTSLLGHQVILPKAKEAVKKPPKPPPPPAAPRTLVHAIVRREYIQPYAAAEFYERRLKPDATIPGGAPDDATTR